MEHPYTNQLLYIKRNVINVLLRNSNSESFKVPVNPELLGIPNYPDIIKYPMDFGTIKLKLDKQVYQTANECKSDFLDVFRNCYIFNEPGSLYVDMALKLENLFKRKMTDLPVPEHYAQDSAFHTPKSNKVKKGKSMKLHTAPSMKPKLPVVINPIIKPDISLNQKRSRSETNNVFSKDEPSSKKAKLSIDVKNCKHILLNLISKKYNDWNRYFLEPVDVEGLKLHDYFNIVKKPMDLGTVKRKLFDGIYQSNEEFAEDVKQIFRNCYLYNPEGHEVHRCGKLLDGIFTKLYQSAFINSKVVAKPSRIQYNCDDLQPLLQKILKRQSEIDSMNLDIIRRNREIQQSIDIINGTELIKSFKASVNLNSTKSTKETVKKINNSINGELKIDETFSPKPELVKKEVKSEQKIETTILSKLNSNSLNTVPFKQFDSIPKSSPKPISSKSDSTKPDVIPNRPTETKRIVKPSFKSQYSLNDEPGKPVNLKRPLNHISQNHHHHHHNQQQHHHHHHNQVHPSDNFTSSNEVLPINNSVKPPQNPTPEISKPEPKKPTKNAEEFNARLKEIKSWITSLSTEMSMKVREFINKSENRNVVSVSLTKLKPATINGLYKMMNEPVVAVAAATVVAVSRENEKVVVSESKSGLKEFTIEDRLQLSQDLRLLGEKFSRKIYSIYKKTEDVQSSDGECEIDFQTVKLVTLHSLREFADKQLRKTAVTAGQPVGNNGDISDSDSSDSSDSDASDSNSDATSSSSDDFFNNLPKPPMPIETPNSVVSNISPKNICETSKPLIESQSINIPQQIVQPEKFNLDNTQEGSRLSDSSDSDKGEEDDDDGDEDINKKSNTPKRPIYSALWNKSSNVDNKKSVSTPLSKPKYPPVQHPMCNIQLSESLRQIVQDAQAHENVKKQEEELRLVRLKEDEEHKRQQHLKIQALNESRKLQHHSENQKKEEDLNRLKEMSYNDRKQRASEIPCVPEREDYHQILCDFEYNIDHDLIMKLVHLDSKQIHL